MRTPTNAIARAVLLGALLLLGCEGQLVVDGPPARDSGVHIDWSDAAAAPDAGSSTTTDAGDPGCALPAGGQCDGDVYRYCDGDVERSEDCGAGGQVCRVAGGAAACSDPPPPPPTACATAIEAAVIELANMARADVGAGPLTCDEDMARTARKHSQDMCDQGYFSHTGLDGRSPFDRMRDEGVSYRTAGENIARGQRTAEAVHTAWMNSDGHRRNILNPAYGRIGVGYVECPGSGPYWTQVFAD